MRKFRGGFVLGMALLLAMSTIAMPSASAMTPHSETKKNTYAYSFATKTVNGATFQGHALAGKPSVLWFWAPWCAICRGEAPDLVALAKSFKGRVNILGVAGLGSVKDMKGFVSDTRTSGFTHVADTSGAVWSHFGIVSQPSFVFVTKSGIMYKKVGSLSKADLFAFTNEIIKKV